MFAYVVRRLFYAIPILIGVNLLTFTLFFVVTSPDDMAVSQLGDKYVTPEAIDAWKKKQGYDLPLFINPDAEGTGALTQTIFFTKSLRLFAFDFGRSESGRDITTDVSTRMWPSLAVALPTFLVGIGVNICVALLVVMFHATRLDRWAVFLFVSLMSISYLFYIIGGQYLVAKTWKLVPISGFHADGQPWKFLILPVLVGVVAGIGSGARWYRTLFLEEANQDYVRTARAKGADNHTIYHKHARRNALLPVITVAGQLMAMSMEGSIAVEVVYNRHGIGWWLAESAIQLDIPVLMCICLFMGVVFVFTNLTLDILYAYIDPRIRLN